MTACLDLRHLTRGMMTREKNLADDTSGLQDKDDLMTSSSGKDNNFEGSDHHTGWNKSCVSCSTSKRKCDGLRPCSRCLQRNEGLTCTYQKRKVRKPHKPHKPRKPHKSRKASSKQAPLSDMKATSSGAYSAVDAVVLYNGDCNTGVVWPRRTRNWLPKTSERLRAPLSTGLMGMQENYLLSVFFGCMPFEPITTQSEIRETIVKMMTSAPKPEVAPLSQENGEEAEENTQILPDVTFPLRVSGGDEVWGAKGSSICVLWSTIALGALFAGRPTESVARYVRLARNAIRSCKHSTAAETLRAWYLLEHADELSGDMGGFRQCLHSTETFIQENVWRGQVGDMPSWLVNNIICLKETTKLISEDSKEILESYHSKDIAFPPEISGASSDTEIYVFISRIKAKMCEAVRGCYGGGRRTLSKPERDSDETLEDLNGAKQLKSQGLQARHGTIDERLGVAAVERLKGAISMAGPLELLMERPNIREGVVDGVIQSLLAIAKATKRDYLGALGHLRRTVEVFERYPGQLRYSLKSHIALFVASFLVILDEPEARKLYNRLRAMYNRFHTPDCGPIPPPEQWQGVRSYCHSMLSRLLEDIVTLLLRRQLPRASACNGGAYSKIGLAGAESTSLSAEERQCSIVADRKRVELPDPEAANNDGYVDCDGVGYPTQSISLTAWAGKEPTEPEYDILRTREAITSAAPRFGFDCFPTTAIGSFLADGEQKGDCPLLVVDGGSSSNNELVKHMEREVDNDISPRPKYSSKGNTIVELTLRNDDWVGGSSSSSTSCASDITAQDWLHVLQL